MDTVLSALSAIAGKENVTEYESMKKHTTFRIGGNARFFVAPEKDETIVSLLEYLTTHNIPYYITGNGSNILCSDKGYEGVVISLGSGFSKITLTDETHIKAQAGALLSKAASLACSSSLTGMEFAAGIPGSIGGALVMNAGAYGGEIKDIFESADCVLISEKGVKRVTVSISEADFSYRNSFFKKNNCVILSAVFKLTKAESPETVRSRMDELAEKRKASQPLTYPSAGSTFKRPAGGYAAALIQESGLKGFAKGDACVSEKHSGFIINKGNACCEDVFGLISEVREKVYNDSGILLEPEVCFLGEMPGRLFLPEGSEVK